MSVPHSLRREPTHCQGADCGDNASGDRFNGVCDKNGCDLQTYRLGNTTFYGNRSRFAIDSSKPVTVVTQFVTADGTDSGALKEIRRFYKQGTKTIQTPTLAVGSGGAYNSLSEGYCTAEKDYFNDGTNFLEKGGFSSMDDAMEKGLVLVMSIWDDHDVNMLWLDSTCAPAAYHPAAAPRGAQADRPRTTAAVPPRAFVAPRLTRLAPHCDLAATRSTAPSLATRAAPAPPPRACQRRSRRTVRTPR